ncbi:MAG: hypothetical protein CME10_12020 [Gemmatimonadetes bacterium]|nr:hypothetical protein [Gemmatimonadota bacterium]|tara:strand:- start:163 stop:414 length:252 start_codon:yes stop_codon:yes gene_type:complete
MIDKELLDILACPENKTPVSMAEQTIIDQLNEQIANGKITNRGGKIVENPLDGGLIREDKKFLYPIDDGIPIMLIDEAISLDQ